ncbi:phospholipase D-like domain-containing protein [Stakelama sediminis]|uniref:Phospholipase D n=1 Tax=Stakelama sediminis TaxID=463200 RepID=A0A840YU48_9SPHN|nr:phospholipase D-like domain-containing protein [Stakelama sediminis]MBB5717161.1 phosphatidylserine/phosphatidylglycerophosphate/cardiolipin synthase-like enzyme [Stakelama sediminis]
MHDSPYGIRRPASRTLIVRALLTLFALLLPTPVLAQFTIPGFELVHNAPADTVLETPHIRDAGTVWVDMIDHAQHSIDLEQFYVSGKKGSALDRVIGALEAAGKRGVHIRFLMERKGLSMSDTATLDRLKAIPNLTFRTIAWSDIAGSGIIHAKFFIVDGHAAYIGSQNFDWRSLSQIDETGLRITDRRIAAQVQQIFNIDWRMQARIAAGKPVPPLRTIDYAPITGNAFLVASPNAYDPPGVGDSQATLVKLIGSAHRAIDIEVMEYSTTAFGGGEYHVIDDALRAAAKRGVKVRLLISDWDLTEKRLPGLIALSHVPNIDIRVSRIPQAASGFIPYARTVHTKAMTIDGTLAWIGTSNWEGGYLDTSRNLEVVLRNEKMANEVEAMHQRLWNASYTAPLAEALKWPRAHPGGNAE